MLGEVITEGETLPEDEEGMGETGIVMESVEGMRVMLVAEVACSEGPEGCSPRGELDTVGEEVFGSEGFKGFGMGMVNLDEGGAEVGEHGNDGRRNDKLAAGEEGEGEVMRGMGEDGWGEKGKVGDKQESGGGY